jgi:hypothetical protein
MCERSLTFIKKIKKKGESKYDYIKYNVFFGNTIEIERRIEVYGINS